MRTVNEHDYGTYLFHNKPGVKSVKGKRAESHFIDEGVIQV